MRAAARLEVARRDGRDVLVDARSEPPMAVRQVADRVLVVGTAAAPVGGDELSLDVVVGAGARLSLGTVAATMVWPGPRGAPSSHAVSAVVGEGGHLAWTPEPMVLVEGCRHRSTTTVALSAGATVWIVEEVSLGRTAEAAGRVDLEWRVERDGEVLVHHAERLGPGVPGWGSAVAVGQHRHLIAALAVGDREPFDDPRTALGPRASAARLQVADDAWVVLAVAADRPSGIAALAALTSMPGQPVAIRAAAATAIDNVASVAVTTRT